MRHALQRLRDRELDEPFALAAGETPWIVSAKLKLVDGCNLRCFMCDYPARNREQELSTAAVKAVLDDLVALQCRKVHFSGGEVFLRRDFLELCRHAADAGLRVNLTTNGTLLTKSKVRELLDAGVRSVTLSIDSPIDYVHDAVRGQRDAFKRTVAALDRLLARRGPKVRVRVNTVVSRRTFMTLLAMPAFLRERNIDGWLLIPMDAGGESTGAMRLEDIRRYNAEVAPMLEMLVQLPEFDPWVFGRTEGDHQACARRDYARGYYEDHRCWAPWFHTLIDARGDVYPCCSGHRRVPPLGNVNQTPLTEIVHGASYRELRQQMWTQRLAVCAGCDDFLADNALISGVLDR